MRRGNYLIEMENEKIVAFKDYAEYRYAKDQLRAKRDECVLNELQIIEILVDGFKVIVEAEKN